MKTKALCYLTLWITLLLISSLSGVKAQISPDLFKSFTYRNIGAFRAGAWVGDIAVPEKPDEANRYTFYVALRAGGVWKTINNGTTFFCITDELETTSIGAVEVAPQNPEQLWVGTGEAFNARSSYAGNGIFRSDDGGKSWIPRGLANSHHINRIVIHPQNPNIVYVAVMGHLFTPNEERGVFKTTDGGETWEKILYINEHIGVIDLVMNRSNPDVIYAASYEKYRLPWTFEPAGQGSRIYKTTDGGESWDILTNGLPQGEIGRIGIDIHRANPNILYAVIQNLNPDPNFDLSKMRQTDANIDATYDALIGGEVYRSDDAGESWRKVSDENTDVSGKAAYSFNQIYVDPVNPENVYIIGVSMFYSFDGGKTWPQGWRSRDRFVSNFGDVRCFWIDPEDPRHIKLGSDGGIYSTWDQGLTMNHYYHIPGGEVYDVEADDSQPYNVYLGLQDHETWKGPSNNWSGAIGPENWVITGEADGMYTKIDRENNRWLYYTGQFGLHNRVDQLQGTRQYIIPKAEKGEDKVRFTWTTPLEISPFNNSVIYTGGQHLHRSMNRGDTWEKISPDLTTNDPEKINGKGHMQYCAISAINESPLEAGVIWVGTDDGRVQLTRNHGATWEDLTNRLHGKDIPAELYVTRAVASAFNAGTAYITKSGFRNDLFEPFIYKTTDYGASWTSITDGLPDSPVSALCEDPSNPQVLYAGTDAGVYLSLDGGDSWMPFKGNMPPAPVTDLMVHPREKDLIVGTYGRGCWITDVAPMAEIADSILTKRFHLFNILPKPQFNYSPRSRWGNYEMTGDNHLRPRNEPNGLEYYYYLGQLDDREEVAIQVTNWDGQIVFEQKANREPGLHRAYIRTERMVPGKYRVSLLVGKSRMTRTATVLESPVWPIGFISPNSAF